MVDFKAKKVGDKIEIKAIAEKRKNKNGGVDVIVHAPSLELINKFRKEQNGKRNI